ncbi:PAS/PAC sensor-containing signal transduction diguanylate cyclase/phosphodiesterase [Oleiphilus messinensis]|uniref:cyclic-guanylate-specific phosphodiesterase n=1 Tax=Oleiphilus messinensis TaxID=141451 RepID=A0A1Y0IAX9_9GAMM|nr:EAL domain-containing protein [Oleiphilus messinensis]ARU56553.1 PAS/PAC sensor-containing signal transduction diguanylate cyclase/phosphodiesterase [Oleiphilus messinensis]
MQSLTNKILAFKKSSPLSYRMLAYILLCSSLFTLFAASIQIYSDYKQDISLVDERLSVIETSYMSSLSRSLWSLDQKLLQVQMEGILNLPDIVHLRLKIYPDSEITMGEIPPGISVITYSFQLKHESVEMYELGELTITASLEDIYAKLKRKVIVILTTQAFKTFFISILILWIFQYLVTRHLGTMAIYARNLNINKLDTPLKLDRKEKKDHEKDELNEVSDAINQMRIQLVKDLERQNKDAAVIKKLSLAIEQSPSSVLICDDQWSVEYANPKFVQLTGHSADDIRGMHPRDLSDAGMSEEENQRLWENIQNQVKRVGVWQGEMHNTRSTGEKFWEQVIITPIKNNDDSPSNYLIIGEDISIRKRYEQQLLRQANYDILTGLPNRMLALDRLKLALAQARRDAQLVGLMFLDLDNFKHINDTMGHDAGDSLLIEASRRVSSCLRGTSTVARLGGDEFLVILPSLDSPEDANQVADRILATFAPPFNLNGQEVFISTSIGIALYPTDSDNSSNLLQHADAAMYQAKSKGKSAYQRFSPEMKENSHERIQIESRLRRALELDELQLYYQPIVEAKTGRVVGTEALIRWNNPAMGIVSPDKFIPLAEETGLIIPIGNWVLQTACRDMKRWQEETGIDFLVAVNVSPRQFRDASFVRTVLDALKTNELEPKHLELEITERLILDDSIETSDILRTLDKHGVRLSVDDFGTGYSALGYLKSYPFDTLKIDKSFVQDVINEAEDAALVTAIITMAHSLGLEVIAEGVEEQEQLVFLREHNCDCAQGYLFSKPVTASEFKLWLTENHKRTA